MYVWYATEIDFDSSDFDTVNAIKDQIRAMRAECQKQDGCMLAIAPKMGDKNATLRLSAVLTKKIDEIPNIMEIISVAREIEKERNEIVYGAPLKDDAVLRSKISEFLEIKKLVEGVKNE